LFVLVIDIHYFCADPILRNRLWPSLPQAFAGPCSFELSRC
jgi:hypothetical protein